MSASSDPVALGAKAPDFRLPATDGKVRSLADVAGKNGTVVVFICNHCPYVKASVGRMVADARTLIAEGIGFVAICSNDANSYPEDAFDKMKEFAKASGFPFAYLHDESQSVARAYGAICTPDYFGFGPDLKLRYRGRLDDGRTGPASPNARRELVEAMRAAAKGAPVPGPQNAAMGCSIKWKG